MKTQVVELQKKKNTTYNNFSQRGCHQHLKHANELAVQQNFWAYFLLYKAIFDWHWHKGSFRLNNGPSKNDVYSIPYFDKVIVTSVKQQMNDFTIFTITFQFNFAIYSAAYSSL